MTSPSTSATSTRPASSPFDGSTGDLTLQSSDGVEFHCFGQILVSASPVFEGMVTVGNPTPDSLNAANHRPIVPMSEDSKTLDALLRLIYPIQKPSQLRLLEDIEPLLKASMKYIMEYPTATLTQELLVFARSHSMQVWAIGCRHMLEEVARAGAEGMLQHKTPGSSTHTQQFVSIDEFIRTADAHGVTAADYYRLRTYHRHRGKVEEGFLFTRPLPREDQDRPAALDLNVPWDFFFFDITLSDATCLATDGMPFPVHAGLLCMNSPVLKEKILRARRRATTPNGGQFHCRIRLRDESPVLAHLLRLCYPGDAVLPADHRLFLAILKSAESYNMTRVSDLLRSKWDAVAGTQPTSAYFAALKIGFPELARVAALKISPPWSAVYIPEMENTPAIALQGLYDYWAAAEAAVDRVQKSWENLRCTKTPTAVPLRRVIDLQRLNDYWATAEAAPDRVQTTSGCAMPATTTPLYLTSNRDESRCRSRGSHWMQRCRDEVLADVRRKLVGEEMPTVEDLVRRSVARSLAEKPWCASCCDIARDILKLGTAIKEKVISALDEVPLIV